LNFKHTTLALLIACAGSAVLANGVKTRDEVKAELFEAIRTGNILSHGETSLKLNELFPGRYPAKPAAIGKSRDEVNAELSEARKNGDLIAAGESGLPDNQINPSRYAAVQVVTGKTRNQVKAELAEAMRTGDVIANGDAGIRLNELNPDKYARLRARLPRLTAEIIQAATKVGSGVR
jgi:Domain of unknown function (DUF4148)